MKIDIIHQNVRCWGKDKNQLANYYLSHNPDVITINAHGLDTRKNLKKKYFLTPTKHQVMEHMQGWQSLLKVI